MVRALLLFSEGLDSLLAGLILKEQGVEVVTVRFITPYFGYHLKENPRSFQDKIKKLGFGEGVIINITEEFLEILKKPKHGYGCLANPCIDCKILMLKKAKDLLPRMGADFIVTGEVMGERPMSQNERALRIIEEEGGVKGILLRPLSAKLLPPTEPEIKGLVKREKLLNIKGRRRTEQIRLAKSLGLSSEEIPTPAGGCLLTDPVIGNRILEILRKNLPLTKETSPLTVLGRHYLTNNYWAVLGRNEEENKKIIKLSLGKFPLYTLNEPSPVLAILYGEPGEEFLLSLLLSRAKKAKRALEEGKEVKLLKV